ncbi:spike base protein, RCAP_Rcc01079 family [Pseudogemmobacter faecipullorum]|uniref:Uncharacterized protein n=1 Tax=Pseudogemmobacter faecipullorum TaxID=2755041 RepID=A0ABS8CN66_9RHOB|nr:hypothetical protein [Pseudogemmobacter faecipullorum]MCB5410817.1 hypothetical protein [Pseudogemmobacter faecipullorum]
MSDPFTGYARSLDSPALFHQAITPSDSADLAPRPRVLYCSGSGTAVLRDTAGTELSYSLQQGQILPLSPLRVLASGTTASLIGWW